MSQTSIVCIDCGCTYIMPETERIRFEGLIRTLPNFRMPRRCAECRKKRRNETPAMPGTQGYQNGAGPALGTLQGAPESYHGPQGTSQEMPYAFRSAPTAEELLKSAVPWRPIPTPTPQPIPLVLVGKDFEDLVAGRPVIHQGVRIILADIGVDVMRKAIDRAVIEKALSRIP